MVETTLNSSVQLSPEEKRARLGIAMGAAKVGQLTKMVEHVVESDPSTITEASKAVNDGWDQKRGLAQPALIKSSYFKVIHEAATVGRMRPVQSLITTNNGGTAVTMTEDAYRREQQQQQLEGNRAQQRLRLQQSRRSSITEAALLVDSYVQSQTAYKRQVLLSPKVQLERWEEMQASKDGLAFLSPIVPRLAKSVSVGGSSQSDLPTLTPYDDENSNNDVYEDDEDEDEDADSAESTSTSAFSASRTNVRDGSSSSISLPLEDALMFRGGRRGGRRRRPDHPDVLHQQVTIEAARQAQNRLGRIAQHATLRMKGPCTCQYCINPSPYQTQFYKQLALGQDLEQAIQVTQSLFGGDEQSDRTSNTKNNNTTPRTIPSQPVDVGELTPDEETDMDDDDDENDTYLDNDGDPDDDDDDIDDDAKDDEDHDLIRGLVSLNSTSAHDQDQTAGSSVASSVVSSSSASSLSSNAKEWAAYREFKEENQDATIGETDRFYKCQLFEWHEKGFALNTQEQQDFERYQKLDEERTQRRTLGGSDHEKVQLSSPNTPSQSTRSRVSSRHIRTRLDESFHQTDDVVGEDRRTSIRWSRTIVLAASRSHDSEDSDDIDEDDSFENLHESEDLSQHYPNSLNGEMSLYLQDQLREMEMEDKALDSRRDMAAYGTDDIDSCRDARSSPLWRPLHQKNTTTGLAGTHDEDISKATRDGSSSSDDAVSVHSFQRRLLDQISSRTSAQHSHPTLPATGATLGSKNNLELASSPNSGRGGRTEESPTVGDSDRINRGEDDESASSENDSSTSQDTQQIHTTIPATADFDSNDNMKMGSTQNSARGGHIDESETVRNSARMNRGEDQKSVSSSTLSGNDSTTSQDRRLLEAAELDELNELYDRRDDGEDVDENRLYELELFDRYRQGEDLNDVESRDLEFYKKRRKRIKRHIKEYNNLCDRQDAGDEVDLDRLYFLELVARDQVGEALTDMELEDLDGFEADEEAKEEQVLKEKQNAQVKSGDLYKNPLMLVDHDANTAPLYQKDLTDDSSLSSREVEELDELLCAYDEGRPVDNLRLNDLDIYDR
jgi:hypothetical protein